MACLFWITHLLRVLSRGFIVRVVQSTRKQARLTQLLSQQDQISQGTGGLETIS